MTSGSSRTPPRATRFGKYLLLEPLHVGSTSEVFLGKAFGADGFEKFVALKRLRGHLASDVSVTQRFVEEAKLLGTLSHAHITPIYELGRVGPMLYTVMEHVWGHNLRTIIERRGEEREAPVGMAAFVGARLCDALHYAHKRRADGEAAPVYHGDLEPRNVLVSYHGTVKLVDFALPGHASDEADALLDGRALYRSPEQLAGGPVDALSDMYSLGACVYELLTGRSPGDEGAANQRRPGSDAERVLLDVLARCMARNRRRRPDSMGELQQEFLRALRLDGQAFTTSRAADWMRWEFGATFEQSKQRLNAYAALRSLDDVDLLQTSGHGTADPMASDSVGAPLPSRAPENGGTWDDATTEIHLSSGELTASESPPGMVAVATPGSVELATNALIPEPAEARRKRRQSLGGTETEYDEARPKRRPLRTRATRKNVGVSPLWYAAGGLALTVIGLVVWTASRDQGEGQIEIREREGRPAGAWVDGVPRGQTPLRLEHVPTGTRRVELRLENGETVARDVVVRPNVTALVELSVLPQDQPVADRPGLLTVTTEPRARVHLDGRPTGRRTPITDLPLAPGRHVMRLVTDDGRTLEEEIVIEPGESLRIARRVGR